MSIDPTYEAALMKGKRKKPWHVLVIGLVFVLIYLIGVYDYVLIHSHDEEYMNSLPVSRNIVAYFSDYPFVFTLLWAVNVFGGVSSGMMLLFGSKWVVWVSFAVAVCKLCLDVFTFLFRNRWEVFGAAASVTDLVVLVVSFGFFFYCRALVKRGVLV